MGDTPNEKMSRVRNLIRFPATGRDRRIRLEESRDPRIRFVTKLRFVCGWLLAVGAFCFVLMVCSRRQPFSARCSTRSPVRASMRATSRT